MFAVLRSASMRRYNAPTTRCASCLGTVHARERARFVSRGSFAAPPAFGVVSVAAPGYMLGGDTEFETRERGAVVAHRLQFAGDLMSNPRVNPPARPVTPRACARVAPVRPAGYAHR